MRLNVQHSLPLVVLALFSLTCDKIICFASNFIVTSAATSIYGSSPQILIRASGFESEWPNIYLELQNSEGKLQQSKNFTVIQVRGNLALTLKPGSR